jgi:hypothetical protein
MEVETRTLKNKKGCGTPVGLFATLVDVNYCAPVALAEKQNAMGRPALRRDKAGSARRPRRGTEGDGS